MLHNFLLFFPRLLLSVEFHPDDFLVCSCEDLCLKVQNNINLNQANKPKSFFLKITQTSDFFLILYVICSFTSQTQVVYDKPCNASMTNYNASKSNEFLRLFKSLRAALSQRVCTLWRHCCEEVLIAWNPRTFNARENCWAIKAIATVMWASCDT